MSPYNAYIMLKIGYNTVQEGEESLILLVFSSPAVRGISDLYCISNTPDNINESQSFTVFLRVTHFSADDTATKAARVNGNISHSFARSNMFVDFDDSFCPESDND